MAASILREHDGNIELAIADANKLAAKSRAGLRGFTRADAIHHENIVQRLIDYKTASK